MNEMQAQRLVELYSDMILRIAYHYMNHCSDAEDICQSVFLKYLTMNKHFKDCEHEKAWIIRTTINECKDSLKSAWRRKTVPLDAAADKEIPAEPQGELSQAIKKLPKNYRLSIYLHYYEGYSAREIGLFIGKNENTVCAYLSRGRKKLKDILSEGDEGGFRNVRV